MLDENLSLKERREALAELADRTAPAGAWRKALERAATARGGAEALGTNHLALSTDGGAVLLVTFETMDGIRTGLDHGQPLGWELADEHGWSQLCIVSDGDTWFRDPAVFAYFDRLVDEDVFDDYDRVIFYGAGSGGYAAAAFSVAAPGATVIALAPQATLDPARSAWDHRFPQTRRMEFTSRYGYAPDMVEGAAKVVIVHDPWISEDAMHASLFHGPHVLQFKARAMGMRLEETLLELDVLPELIAAAGDGALTPAIYHTAMRARREHVPYLRNLMVHLEDEGRAALTVRLCRWVISRRPNAPRFKKALARAQKMLDAS